MDIGVGQVPRAAALAIIIMSASPAAAQDACQATPEHSIVVCFDATPLTIEHCFKTLQPHFAIDVWQPPDTAPVAYRYSYQVIAAGKGVPDPPQTVGDDDDPRRFPFIGRKRVDTFRT